MNRLFIVRGWPEGEGNVSMPSYQVVVAESHAVAELIALQRPDQWQHPQITTARATETEMQF